MNADAARPLLSLHLGVNAPDPAHYGPRIPTLTGAEADARAWASFAASRGFTPETLLGPDATTHALAERVATMISRSPVAVLLTWAGHGAQVPVATGVTADGLPNGLPAGGYVESDGLDEAWVLYDRMLIDDEVRALLAGFQPPTRLIVVADSCHSGSSFALLPSADAVRSLDDNLATHIFTQHEQLYIDALKGIDPRAETTALMVGLAACRDEQRAREHNGRGVFTQAILGVLEAGFSGDYSALLAQVSARTPGQDPRAFWYGHSAASLQGPAFVVDAGPRV